MIDCKLFSCLKGDFYFFFLVLIILFLAIAPFSEVIKLKVVVLSLIKVAGALSRKGTPDSHYRPSL